MKKFLIERISDICIWILRKLKVSAIINFRVEGGTLQGKSLDNVYWFNCDFIKCKFLDINEDPFEIPEGKFTIEIPVEINNLKVSED